MPCITLPDGSQKTFSTAVTVRQVAEAIGPGLAKAALAGKIEGQLVDIEHLIEYDAALTLITGKDEVGLDIIRHSTAHLLAQAVKLLFPTAQVTIGPVIEDGFYYDFAFGRAFTPEDVASLEEKMHELVKQDVPVSRRVLPRAEAIAYFRNMGEEYKARIIEDIPENEVLTLYKQGDFEDLCRGPHVPSTGHLKFFKLTKVAGAYWRGDSNNEMLQRIYGTAWADKKSLAAYWRRLEEAGKRDHRKIGKAQSLFHFQEEAPGMVFWHPKGWTINQIMRHRIRTLLNARGYLEVCSPQVLDRVLWEKSGHWEMFAKEMFTTETESHIYAIKPMNCPCHVQIYNSNLHSYRDLPLRFAEFGNCHRSEPSGSLHGLLRVRNFVQDDGHIFCTEDQIQVEVLHFLQLLLQVYREFGFDDIIFKLATRPQSRIGSDAIWDKAETALENALNEMQLEWQENSGEGAFYGPKIECSLRDCLGRVWQCGTVQVDFSMPERLGATYIAEDGSKKVPVMLHRAILGTIERFLGILIEHYAGQFPTWLAPVQVTVLTITSKHADYAQKITQELQKYNFRAVSDLRNEKIGFKIREHTVQRVPYLVVIGDQEIAQQTITVRACNGEDLGTMNLVQFIERLTCENDPERTVITRG